MPCPFHRLRLAKPTYINLPTARVTHKNNCVIFLASTLDYVAPINICIMALPPAMEHSGHGKVSSLSAGISLRFLAYGDSFNLTGLFLIYPSISYWADSRLLFPFNISYKVSDFLFKCVTFNSLLSWGFLQGIPITYNFQLLCCSGNCRVN